MSVAVAVVHMGVVVVLSSSLTFDGLALTRLALKCLLFRELTPRSLALGGLALRGYLLVSLCCFVQVISSVRCRWRKTRQNQGF